MDALTDLMDRVLRLLTDLDPVSLALVTWAFTAMEATVLLGLLVPGDMVVLLAGASARAPEALVLVVLAAAVGTYTGELLGYGIGRAVGRRIRTTWIGRRIGDRRWDRAEAYLTGRGARVLVPVRFVSMIHALAPMFVGTVRMPVRRFAGWAALGALVWAITYTSIGAVAGSAYREHGHAGLLISAAVVSVGAVIFAVRARRARSRAAELEHSHSA
jgi:membrane-associated protein